MDLFPTQALIQDAEDGDHLNKMLIKQADMDNPAPAAAMFHQLWEQSDWWDDFGAFQWLMGSGVACFSGDGTWLRGDSELTLVKWLCEVPRYRSGSQYRLSPTLRIPQKEFCIMQRMWELVACLCLDSSTCSQANAYLRLDRPVKVLSGLTSLLTLVKAVSGNPICLPHHTTSSTNDSLPIPLWTSHQHWSTLERGGSEVYFHPGSWILVTAGWIPHSSTCGGGTFGSTELLPTWLGSTSSPTPPPVPRQQIFMAQNAIKGSIQAHLNARRQVAERANPQEEIGVE